MRISKILAPLLPGLAVFACINLLLNHLFIPYQFPRIKIRRVETEDFQDLILGTSHGNSAMDPEVISEKTGRSCFNAAAGGQSPEDSLFLLMDACRNHKPERVIIEYDPTYLLFLDNFNANARYQLSVMEFSPVKLAYFAGIFALRDIRYVCMPWSQYSLKIDRAGEILREKHSEAYRSFSTEPFCDSSQAIQENGFMAISDTAEGEKSVRELSFSRETEKHVKQNKAAFERILSYSRRKGIEAVVVMTPVPDETREANAAFYEEAHGIMRELCEEYQAGYLDFVMPEEADETAGLNKDWGSEGFSDGEGHMRTGCAGRFSAMLGELLGS